MILLITDQVQHWFFSLAKAIVEKGGSVLILDWDTFISSSWDISYIDRNLKISCNNNIFSKRDYCQAILWDSLGYCTKDKEDQEYIMHSWFSLIEVINISSIGFINRFDLQANRFKWRDINRLIQNNNCKTIITNNDIYRTKRANHIQSAWNEYVKKLDYTQLVYLFRLDKQFLLEVYYLPDKVYYNNDANKVSSKMLSACQAALKSIGSKYGRVLLYTKKTDLIFIAVSPNLFYNKKISNNLEVELNNSLAKYLISLEQSKNFILDRKISTKERTLAITKSLRPNLLGNSVDY